jgi:hypothetical protein
MMKAQQLGKVAVQEQRKYNHEGAQFAKLHRLAVQARMRAKFHSLVIKS